MSADRKTAPDAPAGPADRRGLGRTTRRAVGAAAAAGLVVVAVTLAWRPVASAVAVERARSALARHDPWAAADLAGAAAKADPGHAELALLSAVAGRRAGRFVGDAAGLDRALTRAAKLGADAEAVRRERVLAAAAAGDLDGPRGVLRELPALLANDRGDAAGICAAYVNGLCLLHRFDAARRLLDAWDEAAPGDAEAAYRRGLLDRGLEDLPAAEANFRRALAAAPHHRPAAVQLANVLRVTGGDGPAAGAAMLAPLAAAPDAGAALLEEYGLCLLDAGRAGDAVAPLERAAAADGRDLDRRFPLALARFAAGDAAGTLEALDPLLAAWPGDAKGTRLRARALKRLGRSEEAAAAFAAAAENDAARGAMFGDARTANDSAAPDADLLYRLGRVILEHEDRGEGLAYLTAAVRVDPRHGPAHAAIAKAHAAAGRPGPARRHRRLAARYGASTGTDRPRK